METSANCREFALLFACCMAGASLAGQARADTTFNVNTTADEIDMDTADGVCLTSTAHCSLRAATMQANHLSGPSTAHIILPTGIYTLTRPATGPNREDNGDLNFTPPLANGQLIAIEGASSTATVIDADQIDRAMSIESNRQVTISKVTIRRGYLPPIYGGGANTWGGGIYVSGNLTISDSIVSANFSPLGGGIYVSSYGQLTVLRSQFLSNQAGDYGGAVYVEGGATFGETVMTQNHATLGGAVDVQGIAEFRDSTVTGNHSITGGGIYVESPGKLYLFNSTLSGNSSVGDGGGIATIGQSFAVSSTISGNVSNGNGGGLFNIGQTWLYSSSIIGNDASHDRNPPGGVGGGVYNLPGKRLVATNSLIEDNTIFDSPLPDDCNGVLEVYGWNLLADYSGCSFTGNGLAARGHVSPTTIGPLGNNGGPTFTHALLPGSEAIDTTTAQGCIGPTLATLPTDQRGAPRIAGWKCDVGAYEYGSSVPATDIIFHSGFD